MLIGKLNADDGVVTWAKGASIGYLAQHQDLEGAETIYDALLEVKKPVIQMEARIRSLELEMKSASGDELETKLSEYEGLWTTIFVKPLAWAIINIGLLLEKIGLGKGLANGFAIVISCLVIRLILYPLTRKTAMQSEKLKEVQPQLEKLEKKYKDKTSEEDQKRKAEEMMAIYSKNKINPLSSCLLSFIQIPLLFAFLEAINRTPVIFENKFLKLDMGTTISHGIMSNLWYAYIIFLLLILATSYFSFRKTLKDQTAMAKQMKGTIYFMLAMILVAAFSLPVALGIYWITSSLFTILQNMLVERKKAKK